MSKKLSILEESLLPNPKRITALLLAYVDADPRCAVQIGGRAIATTALRKLRELARLGLVIETKKPGSIVALFAATSSVLHARGAVLDQKAIDRSLGSNTQDDPPIAMPGIRKRAKLPKPPPSGARKLVLDALELTPASEESIARSTALPVVAVRRELGRLLRNGDAICQSMGDWRGWCANYHVLDARIKARAVFVIRYAVDRPDYRIAPTELEAIRQWAGNLRYPQDELLSRDRVAAWLVLSMLTRKDGNVHILPVDLMRDTPRTEMSSASEAMAKVSAPHPFVSGALLYLLRTSGSGGLLWFAEIAPRLLAMKFDVPASPYALDWALLRRVCLVPDGYDVRVAELVASARTRA